MQENKVKKFIEKNQPKGKKSKLEKYKEEIVSLKKIGYSYQQIKDYLIEYEKIKVNATTICKYFKNIERETKEIPSQKLKTEQISKKTVSIAKPIMRKQDLHTQNQTEQKRGTIKHALPKPITDEDFLNLCDDDQIVYCYYLFLAEKSEEAERLINLPDVDSVTRMLYRNKKRGLYERCYMKQSEYEPEGLR